MRITLRTSPPEPDPTVVIYLSLGVYCGLDPEGKVSRDAACARALPEPRLGEEALHRIDEAF